MKQFTWIRKDYGNRSLNELSKNITEYNTAMLFNRGYQVYFSDAGGDAVEGTLFVNTPMSYLTVENLEVINFLSDHDVYFKHNTEDMPDVGIHKGTFDCLVSLASGDISFKLPQHIGLIGNHYIVDISSVAIKESINYFNEFFIKEKSNFEQLDFFNLDNVRQFLKKVRGTKGLMIISNCFCYAPTSLYYDTELRLKKQNQLIELLVNDRIDWYVDIVTADGISYRTVPAIELLNKSIDKQMRVIPWI